jgi:hypothetical protein
MTKAEINVLRILQGCTFYDTMIVQSHSKNTITSIKGRASIKLDGPPFNRGHLTQLLDENIQILSAQWRPQRPPRYDCGGGLMVRGCRQTQCAHMGASHDGQ